LTHQQFIMPESQEGLKLSDPLTAAGLMALTAQNLKKG
jgi:hypothetical protein